MNSRLEIDGGIPLHGNVTAAGNKNAVLPMLAAALLTDEPVQLENVPGIDDVRTMLRIAETLGVDVNYDEAEGRVELCARRVNGSALPPELCGEVRAGILFTAPLLHRVGKACMHPPGGDVIGRRRLDSHFVGLQALGTDITLGEQFLFKAEQGLSGGEIFLPEASVTATAQILMAAALAEGTTTVRNAACEPHIQDLARLLCDMGGAIDGIGSNTLTIHGVDRLHGARYRVSSDYTEAGSFLALAAATGGDVTVHGTDPSHYRMTRRVFERFGVTLDIGDDHVAVPPGQELRIAPDLAGGIPVVDDGIWPQFPSDLMSVMIVMATQAAGTVLFFEKMYESRMYFVDRLVAMGANAVVCDPHRVVIAGPSRLHGIDLSSPDIRAGIALVGAALCARGHSVIRNVRLIDRGYENIDAKLRALGANVTRIEE